MISNNFVRNLISKKIYLKFNAPILNKNNHYDIRQCIVLTELEINFQLVLSTKHVRTRVYPGERRTRNVNMDWWMESWAFILLLFCSCVLRFLRTVRFYLAGKFWFVISWIIVKIETKYLDRMEVW